MKTLHLNLKRKWFDMYLSGEKKEEYREIKAYWCSRLFENWNTFKPSAQKILLEILLNNGSFRPEEFEACIDLKPKSFDVIKFKNGFARNGNPAPSFKMKYHGLCTSRGCEKWGAEPGKVYFVLKLCE